MIQCPNCQHQEMVGALFCAQCGAPVLTTGQTPSPIDVDQGGTNRMETGNSFHLPPDLDPDPGPRLSLFLMESGEVLTLVNQNETTLGRVSTGQPVVPDLDLGPYQAYEAGVSRLHASLRMVEDQVVVVDLGSANGTRINGQKIPAHLPQPIHHGDVIVLGKFRIQVLLGSQGN